MRINHSFTGAALAALALGSLALPAQAAPAECFDSGTTYQCDVEREADGSFTASSPEHGEVLFQVFGSGEAQRFNYNESEGRAMRAGDYRAITNPEGCWQSTQSEADIFCAWD